MKKSRFLLKLAAVVSSLLLVGVFVSYRAGAFDWLTRSSETPPDLGGNTAVDASINSGKDENNSFDAAPLKKGYRAFMYSSKSIAPLIEPSRKEEKSR
jgi:hypothetical protein